MPPLIPAGGVTKAKHTGRTLKQARVARAKAKKKPAKKAK